MADLAPDAETTITVVSARTADATTPEELPSDERPVKPLDMAEEPSRRTKLRVNAIIISLMLVLFIVALDQTVLATSTPTISAALHSATGYTWMGSAYLLANAASGPIWARSSDIWGRKPALLAAIGLFAAASLIAALSTSMAMLIAARALQGTAGGGIGQLVFITISDMFSVRKRPLYVSYMGLVWAVAGSAGPVIGGSLTQLASWRWCFYINLPVCGIALVLVLMFLDVHNPHTTLRDGFKAIDWFGTLAILGVTLLLLLGLDFGGAIFPWNSPKVICLIVFGGVMVGFLIFSEKRLAKYPVMPLSVFTNLGNSAAIVIAFAHSMVSIGIEYYLPLYFQSVKQVSPLRSGVLILPMMLTEASVDIASGLIMSRTGRYREMMWIGAIFMSLGTGLYITLQSDSTIAHIAGLEIVCGVGVALLFQAPIISIQNTVSQSETASATATMGFLRNIATSLSIVIGGVVFQNSMDTRQSFLAAAGLSDPVLEALVGKKAAANVDIVKSIRSAGQREAVQDAFAWSIRNMFIMYTCVAAIALTASAFIKHQKLREEHTETKTGIDQLKKQDA